MFTWPTDAAATTYQIDIYKDGTKFCSLTLDSYGRLLGISFAPRKVATDNAETSSPYALSFMVTGLDAASRYNYVLSALDENGKPLHVYTGAFATTGYTGDKPVGDGLEVIPTPPIIPGNPEEKKPTNIEEIPDENGTFDGLNGKVFLNGQLYILYKGVMYNAQGMMIGNW